MTEPLPFVRSDASELRGQVEATIYRSPDERFAVLRIKESTHGQLATVVGPLGTVAEGESLRLKGRWTKHPKHGERFVVENFSPIPPTTLDGLIKYLGSGLIPGVGPSVAERIVKRFGTKTLDIITTQSARLREVKGVGNARAQAIATAVRTRRQEAESLAYLHGLNIGPALARKIYTRYKDHTAQAIESDPYKVAEEISGVGFRTADRIGLAAGFAHDDIRRVKSAVRYVLFRASEEGHTYLSYNELAHALAGYAVSDTALASALSQLDERGEIRIEDQAIFLSALFAAECYVAQRLSQLAQPRTPPEEACAAEDKSQATLETLSPLQRQAAASSLRSGLLVLTGGPGTGKTTAVSAILHVHRAANHRVALCAPTGRAAKRLSEATGHPASTIHRLLEWNPSTASFSRNARMPLDADLVLIDEASMLDLPLCQHLLAAISDTASVVFVGDVNQLPPIGPGHVLRAILDSQVGTVIRLSQVFRQAEKSAIVRAAHALLQGKLTHEAPATPTGDGDLFVLRTKDSTRSIEKLLYMVERIRQVYKLDSVHDVQVLSAMRKGQAGIDALNEILQTKLNPSTAGSPPNTLRLGDKVMQLRNDYDRDVYNGDLGRVASIQDGNIVIDFDGRNVAYGTKDLDALTLAYACTIHKAQGSEFPAVIIILDTGHHVLLNRSLLYTAMTRGRKLAVIIGPERALERAARNVSSRQANTRLNIRLATNAKALQARHHETPGETP